MHVIIDADPIVYRAGFMAETHGYDVVVEHPRKGMEQIIFTPKPKNPAGDQMKKWFKAHPKAKLLSKVKFVADKEPLDFALQGVKMTIKACVREATKAMLGVMESDKRIVPQITALLTGPGNFRDEIATILPYKGNRVDNAKPFYYQQIRDYLCDAHDAQVIEGHEADDECSILAHADEGPHIVCSIDKDLDQIPGMHYDYMKKVVYKVEPTEGLYLLWRQTLTGDSTDNIQGMYRCGDAKAIKLLDKWLAQENVLPVEQHIWGHTVAAYAANITQYPEKYPDDMSAYDAALENARLVNMQTYRGQLWTPPGMPDEETT